MSNVQEAERSIIGICLIDGKRLPYVLNALSEDSFEDIILSKIYRVIKKLNNNHIDVDIITVSDELAKIKLLKDIGGRAFINDLAIEVISPSNFKSYIKIILEDYKRRRISALVKSIESNINTVDDIDSFVMDVNRELTNISSNTASTTAHHISEAGLQVYENISSIFENKKSLGIPTGYSYLDRLTGGVKGGQLWILGGRPSMGKSLLAMNIAEYISRTKNVLFISAEMDRNQYAKRCMLPLADIDNDKLNDGNITEEDLRNVSKALNDISKLNLYIDDSVPCTLASIELSLLNLINREGSCGLLVIDYLQLLSSLNTSKRKGYNREQELAEISRELKQLARRYNVPIIALAQLSRALELREDKRPMLSDLRESGAIEQDADIVMFIYRDEYYYPDNPEAKGKAELLLRKNRDGKTGNVYMAYYRDKCRFIGM